MVLPISYLSAGRQSPLKSCPLLILLGPLTYGLGSGSKAGLTGLRPLSITETDKTTATACPNSTTSLNVPLGHAASVYRESHRSLIWARTCVWYTDST